MIAKGVSLISGLSPMEAADYVKLLGALYGGSEHDYAQYADDAEGFIEEVLGEYLTDDLREICRSVVKYPVTIAQSGNGTGKSWIEARLALWFFKCRTEPQIYCAAAPPQTNLENILWAEISATADRHKYLVSDSSSKNLKIERSPREFIAGVAIPSSGTDAQRQARFCADADDLIELTDGRVVAYSKLIDVQVTLRSVDQSFNINSSVGEFFDNGLDNVYEVVLSSGVKVRRTAGHLLFCGKISRSYKQHGGEHIKGRVGVFDQQWVMVDKLSPGDAILIPKSTEFNFGSGNITETEAKVMAYMIGDGCMSSRKLQFSQQDGKPLKEFIACVKEMGGSISSCGGDGFGYHVNGNGEKGGNSVLNLFSKNGMIGRTSADHKIPAVVNTAKKEIVAIFLNRLFSMDGWACVAKVGKYKKAEIGYVSKSEELVRDIQRLLHRFGVMAILRKQVKSWTHKGIKKYGEYWVLTIARAHDVIAFCQEIGIYGKEKQLDECLDYSLTRNACATWRESSPEGFLWDRVSSVTNIGKRPTVGVTVPGDETYLTSVVEHNSGKHAPSLLFLVDEGDAVPDPVFSGIETCLSGGFDRLLVTFNPRERRGAVYRMVKDGKANVVKLSALNHPNVITGEDKIPGAVNREKTIRRISQWTRPLNSGEARDKACFQLPEYLVGCVPIDQQGRDLPALVPGWYRIIEHQFSHVVLGEYPAQADNQLISEEWIDKARSRYDLFTGVHGVIVPEHIRCTVGLDIADHGKDHSVMAKRFGNFVHPLIAWDKQDVIEVGDLTKHDLERNKIVNIAAIYCDGTGVGAGTAPYMVKRYSLPAVKVMVAWAATDKTDLGEFGILLDQLMWEMREWLRTDQAMLPPDADLIEELLSFNYEVKGGKVKVSSTDEVKELLKRSPDRARALMFTFMRSGFFAKMDLS